MQRSDGVTGMSGINACSPARHVVDGIGEDPEVLPFGELGLSVQLTEPATALHGGEERDPCERCRREWALASVSTERDRLIGRVADPNPLTSHQISERQPGQGVEH